MNPCICLSTWLNATLHIACFVLSRLKRDVCSLCLCREPRQDDALLTDDLACVVLWVTTDPTDRTHFTGHTKADAHAFSLPTDVRVDFYTSYKLMCTHTHRVHLTLRLRCLRCSNFATDAHGQLCTLPHPIRNWVLTSNIGPLLSTHKLRHSVQRYRARQTKACK